MAEPNFPDKMAPPSRDDVFARVGVARDRWLRLEDWARRTYGIEGEAIFLGRDTGWSIRFRRGGRALFSMVPRTDSFAALVVIGPSVWTAADALSLSRATRVAWDAAHPYPDGRWLWLDVVDDLVASDVEALVALKSPPPRRPRPRRSPHGLE